MINLRRRVQAKPAKPTRGVVDGYAYVDLGLPSKIKWATCNVGATTETGIGGYYCFGQGSSSDGYNPYHSSINTSLPNRYDVARQRMGGSWLTPTKDQFKELVNNCTFQWYSNFNNSGVAGAKFTGPNGDYIFFPAGGYFQSAGDSTAYQKNIVGRYFSKNYYSDSSSTYYAYWLAFGGSGANGEAYIAGYNRSGSQYMTPHRGVHT